MSTKQPQVFGRLVFGVLILLRTQISAEEFEECTNVGASAFVALDGDCYSYIYCAGSDSYTDRCPNGSHFDAANQQCSTEESSLCRKATAIVAPTALPPASLSSTADPTTATTRSSPEHPHCKRDVEEYFPHPLRCEYYYKCEHGFLTIMHCNFHYGWDYVHQLCSPMKDARCYVGEHTVKFL